MNEEQNNIVLSKTFSSIFNSVEEALWSFDFVKNTLGELGITEAGNKRVAVTFPENRKLHIDFCNWLIFGITKKRNDELEVSIALMEKEMEGYNYKKQYFAVKNDEPQVCLVKMPLVDFRENDKWKYALEKTLPIIKNKFKNHIKTPYLNSNNKDLEDGVFNTEKRMSLLQSDLSVVPENEALDNVPSVSFDVPLDINDLFFEDKDQLIQQIHTALLNKKNIIFTGPPGTGKSKLAQQVCDSYQVDYHMTTATSDWSTYETIGGYMPKSDGTLQFKPGSFLDCFKDATTNKPLNKWLIIDEMNRADIDKAFGSLFSALTGDSIKLDFQSESGESIILRPEKKNEKVPLNDFEYILPSDWRLIGSINTMDKASLYEMSYAFMRRFAFIPISVPRVIDKSVVDILLQKWEVEHYQYVEELVTIWKSINKIRPIGPAIVEDIANYTQVDPDFTSAIILYVLPQFEGLLDDEIKSFINEISNSEKIDYKRLSQFATDFFHLQE